MIPALSVPAPGARCSYIARQPILMADEKVFGYELLFSRWGGRLFPRAGRRCRLPPDSRHHGSGRVGGALEWAAWLRELYSRSSPQGLYDAAAFAAGGGRSTRIGAAG